MSNELITTDLSTEKVALLKRTICAGASDDELQMFIAVANRTGLDPFAKQIHAVKRWDSRAGREIMSIQVSIDGLRLVAQRSGEYQGQTEVEWCGADGVWVKIWTSEKYPYAARVGVWRKDFKEPCYAIAKFSSYASTKKDGSLVNMWQRFAELMIAKCAEALALRKAFPQELSGLYTHEEMQQAETVETAAEAHQTNKPAPNTTQAQKALLESNGEAQQPTKQTEADKLMDLTVTPESVVNFGRHKGKLYKDLSTAYLLWLADRVVNPEPVLKIAELKVDTKMETLFKELKMSGDDLDFVTSKVMDQPTQWSSLSVQDKITVVKTLEKELEDRANAK